MGAWRHNARNVTGLPPRPRADRPPPEGRLPTREAVGRALRRTSKGYWTVTLAALAVLVIALVAGPWSGLVLIAVTVLGLRARRWHRNKGSAPSP